MEMEFNDNRSRGRFVIVMGLILAVIAGGAAFFLISQAQQQAARSGATATIVVAIRQIPARKPIEASDIAVREVPIDPTNAQGVFADPTKVIGLVPGVTILEGQPVYANFLASQAQGGQFSILGPGETIAPDSEAWRAVSLTVPDDRAVGGLVRPGDTVDVFVTTTVSVPEALAEAGRYVTDKSTKITYQDLIVLAKAQTFYVMKVPAALAEEISHLQASGAAAFSLALRPPTDDRRVDASRLGETTNLIIQRYGLPIPVPFPGGPGVPATPRPSPSSTPRPSPEPSPTP
ncbi:MAG TPA: Flp pilus assembly protein CpaB [Patescibacteria group bacterium]|jgi:Flp pilus assembly protein CpaB|nr:Flp pilus assembly protein CpaB [Patescibacteria group bacterium]